MFTQRAPDLTDSAERCQSEKPSVPWEVNRKKDDWQREYVNDGLTHKRNTKIDRGDGGWKKADFDIIRLKKKKKKRLFTTS